MTEERTFLLDANVFIEAKRRYYAFDICPGFWECLLSHNGLGRVLSIDKVKNELEKGGDDLTRWVSSTAPSIFFPPINDRDVIDQYGQIIAWVQGQDQFYPAAIADFAAGADGWLIAYAKVNKLILVTLETFAPDSRSKVPIPNVCREFGVTDINTFEMLRELEAAFSWESSS